MKLSMPHALLVMIIMAIVTSCTQKDYTNITNPGFNQPEISITMPVPGDTLRGLVAISAQASDSAVISYVEFYIDGVLPDSQATDSSAPYEYLWNSVNYADGNHLVFARAWTPEGNYGDAVPLLVLVDNINENAPRTLLVPNQYPTIQQAVNAARDGDTVLVGPGTYHEDFNYRGKGIWVKSLFGPAVTIWEGIYQNVFVYFNSGEDTLSVLCGFRISQAYIGVGIDLNCSPIITNCIFVDIDYTGIIASFTNGIYTNNTLFNCQYGMQLPGICYVTNNIVVHGLGYGLWNAALDPQYAPIGDYNDVWEWGEGNYNDLWIIGIHDISLNPLFQNTVDFRLQPGSPCINAGDPAILDVDGSRSDMGAWGGPYAYQ